MGGREEEATCTAWGQEWAEVRGGTGSRAKGSLPIPVVLGQVRA